MTGAFLVPPDDGTYDTELPQGSPTYSLVGRMFTGSSLPADLVNKVSENLANETDPTERAWQLLLLAWRLNDPRDRNAALNYLQEAHNLACKHNLPHAKKFAEDLGVFYLKQEYPKLGALLQTPGVVVEALELLWRCSVGAKHDPRDDPKGSWADRLHLP